MALTTIPTFTPSGYAQFATPAAALPNPSQTYLPPFYASTANTIPLPAGSAPQTVLVTNLGPEPAIVLLTTAAATTTATGIVGSSTITVASATGIVAGHAAIAAGLNQGTFVVAINGTVVTLSQPVVVALSGTTINFVVPVALSTGIAVTPFQPPLALAYGSNTFISAVSMNTGSRSVLNVAVGV